MMKPKRGRPRGRRQPLCPLVLRVDPLFAANLRALAQSAGRSLSAQARFMLKEAYPGLHSPTAPDSSE